MSGTLIRKTLIQGLSRLFPAHSPSCLMYHSVEDEGPSLCARKADFQAHMAYLASHRTKLSPGNLPVSHLPSDAVMVTFDDGFLDNFEIVVPACVEHGIPVLLFPTWETLGKSSYGLPMMSREQLREASQQPGVFIGSHTLSHPKLSRLAPDEQRNEIGRSKQVLEDWLGREVEAFCYPYGDYSPVTRAIVEECGYRWAYTTRPAAMCFDSPFEIPRLLVNRFTATLLPEIMTEGYLKYLGVKARVQGS